MASLYFPKPQPLSPSPKRRAYMGDDGRYYQVKRGREVLVKGVEQRRAFPIGGSNTYCEVRNTKLLVLTRQSMKKLYNDFGNIFEYKFWDWWSIGNTAWSN